MRKIAVVTVARSDFSIYRPVLDRLRGHPTAEPLVIAGGMHLAPAFGLTVREVEAAGHPVAARVETLDPSDTPEGVARAIGRGVTGFADAYARLRPDLLVVLGDRYEMLAAAAAALPFRIPLAHLHGGEATEGAIDEQMRHAITKMSHLHFVAHPDYARRVIQMGEEPWRVTVSGAPALDAIAALPPAPRGEVERRFAVALDPPPLLVTFHPETHAPERTAADLEALLDALDRSGRPLLFTAPNADAGGRRFLDTVAAFVAAHPGRARLVASLGGEGYYGVLRHAAAMVGNSSSGIIEAASFGLPVVNVGERQKGRLRGANVIDAPGAADAILAAVERALTPAFRDACRGMANPYGDGRAAERIVARLAEVPLDRALLVKRFHDLH
jgi:UDP-hydrolysing UDP-N-acetyl-D-glucosamine 2-epimerase